MGILKDYFNQTRKPEGFLGRMMIIGMNGGHAAMAKWGTSHLRLKAPEKIADLGCGGGSNIKALSDKYAGAAVTGVDHSPLSVEKSREFNKELISAGRVDVMQGDVSELTLEDGAYDLVTAFETVYFWPGLEKCFAEAARILKPEGTFMIVNESDGYDEASKKFEKIIDGMKVYTSEEIERALKAAGFEDVRSYHHEKKPWITVIARKQAGPAEGADGDITIGAPGTEYANWMSVDALKAVGGIAGASAAVTAVLAVKRHPVMAAAGGAITAGAAALLADCFNIRRELAYDGGRAMDMMQTNLMDHLEWDGKVKVLDVGCGSGTLSIRAAKTYPEAEVTGIDYWGMGWDYDKEQCDRNARLEGVGDRCEFIHGDARALDFPDETFDALISNCVYSQIMGKGAADKKQLIMESMRVLKKGGVFAIQDYFDRKKMFGSMSELMKYMNEHGISEVYYEGGQDSMLPKAVIRPYCINGTGILWGKK